MKPTQKLHDIGQSLWLDNITRKLLNTGGLKRYIDELSVTGLTSNPTIFDGAIKNSSDYDDEIRSRTQAGRVAEELFFDLALEDCTQAADLFRPIHDQTDGVDGWVSLEVSPKLAYDTSSTVVAARELHARAGRPNLFIKIPGTREGLPAVEESIFAGIPVNVTLLFSREQYLAAASAYIRGIERRLAAGLNPHVGSVASLFISRWDVAANKKVPPALHNRLGIAIAKRTYKAYRELLATDRWLRLVNNGARSAAAVVGQHRDQGSPRPRRALRQGPGGSAHGQYDAGKYPDGDGRSWRNRLAAVPRWRQCRDGSDRVHQGRGRYRRAGGAASARRRRGVRQILG